MDYDVIIVGAGAAGLMAAVTAAERGRKVLLLEKMDQAGRKLRITGKGRCNLTNTSPLRDTLSHIGPEPRWLRNAYGRFFNQELMDFFESRGVPLTVERGNRVYPASGKSLDIFLALINDLEGRPNVTIRKNTTIKSIKVDSNQWSVVCSGSGSSLTTDHYPLTTHIVLATGGLSYPTTGSTGAGLRIARELGHTVTEPVPALVPLRCQEPIPEELVGFQLKNVQLTLTPTTDHQPLSTHFGEMTFCDDGLAGPIVLSASRVASRILNTEHIPLTAHLDLKPALSPEQLDKRLQADLAANGTRIFNDALRLWLPAELIPLALKQLHIEYYKRLHQITGDERRRLGHWLKDVPFTITGTHDWDEAIITQGGVATSEVNPKAMESKLVQGLYIVGELLDLDADTGGYNLQIAFSTGHAAGQAV